jgi:hypothetical protein
VVGGHGPVVEHRGAEHSQREPGIVGAGVPVEEAGGQVVGTERRHVLECLLPGDLLVATADAHAAGQVVEPQGGRVHAGDTLVDHASLAEQGDEKRQWRYQVGGIVEQPLPFGQVLVHQPVFVLLEVAQSPVDQLRRLGRGARGEIVLFDQGGLETATGGVEGHTGPGNAAADHQHIEALGRHAG